MSSAVLAERLGIAKFDDLTAARVVHYIVSLRQPYGDIQRAWRILGIRQVYSVSFQPKAHRVWSSEGAHPGGSLLTLAASCPTVGRSANEALHPNVADNGLPSEPHFREHVSRLWTDLNPDQFPTRALHLKAKRARRHILAAIKATGFYTNPAWSADPICATITLTADDYQTDRPVMWGGLDPPPPKYDFPLYARQQENRDAQLRQNAYDQGTLRATPGEIASVADIYRGQWQAFHRYYGFTAVDSTPARRTFRALPVPRNQWSLVSSSIARAPPVPPSRHPSRPTDC